MPPDDALRAVVGPPFELGLPLIGVPGDQLWAVIDRYRVHYEGGGLFDCTVYDGIAEMLDALAAAGMVLSLATAKPEETAVRILEHFGLADRFAVLAGATYEPGRRTKDEVITHALRELGIEPGAHVVMVGDRDHDVHGAAVHGIDTIGVLWGYGGAAELTAAGAWTLADTPADVVRAGDGTGRRSRRVTLRVCVTTQVPEDLCGDTDDRIASAVSHGDRARHLPSAAALPPGAAGDHRADVGRPLHAARCCASRWTPRRGPPPGPARPSRRR